MKEQTQVRAIRLRPQRTERETSPSTQTASTAEWTDCSKKKDVFQRFFQADRLLRNMAAAGGLLLVAVAIKNAGLPQSQSVFSAIQASVNTEWDESLGKLSFVDRLLPSEIQEVWREGETASVFSPVQGTIVHAWSAAEPYLELASSLTDVRAAAAGEIMSVAHGMDEERIVRIRHENGLETLYGNLQVCYHDVGDWVYAGDTFARVMEGAPLAFEIRRNGRSVDPTGLMLPFQE